MRRLPTLHSKGEPAVLPDYVIRRQSQNLIYKPHYLLLTAGFLSDYLKIYQRIVTVIVSLIPLLGVKIIYLVDRTVLFKISNLVFGGKTIVTSLYTGLDRTRTESEREPAGRVQELIRVTTRKTT
jgi:hypothetical protein